MLSMPLVPCHQKFIQEVHKCCASSDRESANRLDSIAYKRRKK